MRWILTLPLLLSCAGDQAKPEAIPPQAASVAPQFPAKVETPQSTSIRPVEGIPDGGESASSGCLRDCIKSRQMQATSIEVIESDCRRQCEEDE